MAPRTESNKPAPGARRSSIFHVLAGLAGVIAFIFHFAPSWHNIIVGLNDFPMFYVAPHMISTGNLYDVSAFRDEEIRLLGVANAHVVFTRLPYIALMMEPVSRLPYHAAYVLWQALSIAALACFAVLWPAKRPLVYVICCWFPPVASNFANANDVAFLLLWIALAERLATRGKDFAAGAILSLCAAKPHLFLFLPIWLIARRMWRFSAGMLAGSALLLAVSFAAGGNWPLEFLKAISNTSLYPDIANTSIMGLAGRLLPRPGAWLFGGALFACLAVVVWRVSRRRSLAESLAVTVAAGPIIGFHVYVQDYLLALPLVLMLVSEAAGSGVEVPEPASGNA